MRKILIQKPGGYDRLQLVEAETPSPGPGQVLVANDAVGVNYADCIVRMGLYSSAAHYVGWPITPGFEFSGRVAAVGQGVTQWKEGDPVLGITLFGGYSSHVLVPSHQLFARPSEMSGAWAAGFPTVHLTAWYALCELCRPRPGYKVLVHSAAGGVGSAALGICRHLGMEAVGVVGSAKKVEAARAAGATWVVCRDRSDFWDEIRRLAPRGYDIVLESTGVATMKQSYAALRPTGRLVVFGLSSMLPKAGRAVRWWKLVYHYLRMPRFNPIRMIDQNKAVGAFNLSYLVEEKELLQQAMTELMGFVQAGALREPPIQHFPLAQAGRAQALLESGTTVGKLILEVGAT